MQVDGGDKTEVGSKPGERPDSVVCVPTPEQWPVVDEDTYRHRPGPPTPVSAGGEAMAEEERTSTAGMVDARSDRSGLTSMLVKMSRDNSLHSDKAKHIFHEPPTPSPAPPPPSPEPKTSEAPMLGQAGVYESDSEPGFDLTVKPPSNLDDESRINTPQFCLRTPSTGSRDRSVDGQVVGTARESSGVEEETGKEQGAEFLGDEAVSRDALSRHYGNQLTIEPGVPVTGSADGQGVDAMAPTAAVEPPAATPVGDDAEDKPDTPAGQEDRDTSDRNLKEEDASASEHPADKKEQAEDEAAVDAHDEVAATGGVKHDGNTNDQPDDVAASGDVVGGEDDITCVESAAAVQPGYGVTTTATPGDGEANQSPLEEFDANEENFTEELQKEYDKLS